MATKTKPLSQPSREDEAELVDVLNDGKSWVEVRGRKWGVRYKRGAAVSKVSALLVADGEDEDKVVCKAVAYLRLNNSIRIALFFGWLWRWYYYVMGYTERELTPYIEECKKKVEADAYFTAIILLTGMKDTKMQMTRAEVERIQVELISARSQASPKSTPS